MTASRADERGVVIVCPACGQGSRIAYGALTARTRCGRCRADLPRLNGVVEVADEGAFDALSANPVLPVLVDFWAPWCGPCRSAAPEIERLAQLSAGEAVIAKVNTEELPSIATRHQIQSIPTFVLFRAGAELTRTSGVQPASRLRTWIQQACR